jgi:hypothetical protein
MEQQAAHGSRRRWRMSLTHFRRASVALSAFVLGGTLASGIYDLHVGVRLPGAHDAAVNLADAEVTLWWYRDGVWPSLGETEAVSFRTSRAYGASASLAWRPYHIAVGRFPQTSPHHGLAVPLWPVILGSFLLAGYSHGLVVGSRRATIGRCRVCGYDLRSLPKGAACPECGPAASAKVA